MTLHAQDCPHVGSLSQECVSDRIAAAGTGLAGERERQPSEGALARLMSIEEDGLFHEISLGNFVRDAPRLRAKCGGIEPHANLLQRCGVRLTLAMEVDDGERTRRALLAPSDLHERYARIQHEVVDGLGRAFVAVGLPEPGAVRKVTDLPRVGAFEVWLGLHVVESGLFGT